MNKEKRFVSLSLKMTAAVVIGITLALAVYLILDWFGNAVADYKYMSPQAVEQQINEIYDDLEDFIKEEKVEAIDTSLLKDWLKEHPYTYFYVYDNHKSIFETGWWGVSEKQGKDQSESEPSYKKDEPRIQEDTFKSDLKNRVIKFDDAKYYVFIDTYRYEKWFEIMNFVKVICCFVTLLATILIYHRRILLRIFALSEQVQKVSDGDLNSEIRSKKNDEIGALAASVNNMRNSIIEKHKNEKEAWEANAQLVTAMSHDIRTPLTSMIGYLDIIEGHKYKTEEDLYKYVSSCRDKAFQLKELSDKLFQYFLVFGKKNQDRNLEEFDANILFQQLLAEHCAEIINYGFKVDFDYTIPEVTVKADISSMKRLFDNIFHNILKYASFSAPVQVAATELGENIAIVVKNCIIENSEKIESTRIGLKTCEKICSDLDGTFSYTEEDNYFTVTIIIPYCKSSDSREE